MISESVSLRAKNIRDIYCLQTELAFVFGTGNHESLDFTKTRVSILVACSKAEEGIHSIETQQVIVAIHVEEILDGLNSAQSSDNPPDAGTRVRAPCALVESNWLKAPEISTTSQWNFELSHKIPV